MKRKNKSTEKKLFVFNLLFFNNSIKFFLLLDTNLQQSNERFEQLSNISNSVYAMKKFQVKFSMGLLFEIYSSDVTVEILLKKKKAFIF